MEEMPEKPWWRRLDGVPPGTSTWARRIDDWAIRHRIPVAVGAGLFMGAVWTALILRSTEPLSLLLAGAVTVAWAFLSNYIIRQTERRSNDAEPRQAPPRKESEETGPAA